MKKILCALPQVTGGGAERFLITFLNTIDRTKYQPVVVLAKRGGGFDNEIPEDISTYILSEHSLLPNLLIFAGPLRYMITLINLIRQIKPDAIVSFGSLFNGVVTLSAYLSNYLNPILIVEAIHQTSEISTHSGINKLLRKIFLRWTYPLASKVIAVSEDVAYDLREHFNIVNNLTVIHYGVNLNAVQKLAEEPVNHEWLNDSRMHKVIVACGRFVEQKGFVYLLHAISKIAQDVKLILIGDGEEKQLLEAKVKELEISDRVDMIGYRRNPFAYISKADAFILPSLWEGLPIMLIEVLSLNIPIVACDCPTGPRIILENGECGVLVPIKNAAMLADNIEMILANSKVGNELTSAAKKRSYDFAAQTSVVNYIEVLSEIGNWK